MALCLGSCLNFEAFGKQPLFSGTDTTHSLSGVGLTTRNVLFWFSGLAVSLSSPPKALGLRPHICY